MFPEWMFPLLTGFSVFCLANPRSPNFTRIFGGSNGNEGLGLLSICFDWQYISAGVNPFAIPLRSQVYIHHLPYSHARANGHLVGFRIYWLCLVHVRHQLLQTLSLPLDLPQQGRLRGCLLQ